MSKTAALLGGFLAAGAFGVAHAQAPVSTNLISETTFDSSALPPWGYGYFYPDAAVAAGYYEYNREYYFPEDFEMTNGMWRFSFDISALAGMTGYGAGTGAPLFRAEPDPAAFSSTNREDYVFSFDARVEGLEPGVTTANGEMQVQFYYRNEENAELKSLQVNLPFAPSAEWQRFTFHLGQGGLGDNTSESEFALRAANTSDVRFNANFHEPHNALGFDGDNAFYLDNARLEVISRPPETPLPTFGVTMAEWNFDDKTANNEYHYQWSANEIQPVPTAGNNAGGNSPNELGKDGSSAWFLTLDNTEFINNPPAWAGGGSGGSGPVDLTRFDSGDLASYRVTFEARVEGLAEDRENTAAALQIFLDVPDDTIQPADENTDADLLVRLDVPIARVSREWQTYSVVLNKAGVGLGSATNFAAFHAQISGLRTQWQIENIGSMTDWGYDADNTLVIDNFKLERLYTGLPGIAVTRSENNIVLTWSAAEGSDIKLQESTSVTGEWTDVPNATSGYSTAATGPARFFRLVQEQ